MFSEHASRQRIERFSQRSALLDRLESRQLFAAATILTTPGPGTNLVVDAAGDVFFGDNGTLTKRAAGIYELPGGSGPERTVVQFDSTRSATQGRSPSTDLIIAGDGTLYGRTSAGGAHADGTIFKVVAGSGAITPLASFDANSMSGFAPDPYYPGLVRNASGDLFCLVKGTVDSSTGVAPVGVAELPAGSSTVKLVATLDPYGAGTTPAALAIDPSGNLFIACAYTGQSNKSTIVKLAAGTFAQTVINFTTDVGSAVDSIATDGAGNLFGTAQRINTGAGASVFEIAAGSTTPTVLATFDSTVTQPNFVTLDGADNVFGTTADGGTDGHGMIFEVAVGSGTVTPLYPFAGDAVGVDPEQPLVANGALYGSTGFGGSTADDLGSIFVLPATVTPTSTPTPTPTPTPTSTSTLTAAIGTGSLAASVIAGVKAKGAIHVAVNNGSGTTADTLSSVALYATTTGVVDSASVKLGSVKKSASLKPSKSTTANVPITLLPTTPGTYTLLAVATDKAGIETTSVAAVQSLTVVPATINLAGTLSAPSPTTVRAGKSFTLTLTLTNTGNVDSTGNATATVTLAGAGTPITLTPAIKGPKVKAGGGRAVLKMKLKIPIGTLADAYAATVVFTQGEHSVTVAGTSPLSVS